MRPDCSPNPARLPTAARIWRENVFWSHGVTIVYYSAVDADGEHAFNSGSQTLSYSVNLNLHRSKSETYVGLIIVNPH